MRRLINTRILSRSGAFASHKERPLRKAVPHITLAVAGLFLLGCSPGGVVAGTVGAAGAVAGAAVDVVLRSDVTQGWIE